MQSDWFCSMKQIVNTKITSIALTMYSKWCTIPNSSVKCRHVEPTLMIWNVLTTYLLQVFILDGKNGQMLWSTQSHSKEPVMSSPLSIRGQDNKDAFLFWIQGRNNDAVDTQLGMVGIFNVLIHNHSSFKGAWSDCFRFFFSNFLRFWYQMKAHYPWWILQMKNIPFGRC